MEHFFTHCSAASPTSSRSGKDIILRSMFSDIGTEENYKIIQTLLKCNKTCTQPDTNIFLFYYFKCWQLVLARIGHQQANIYKNLKMLVHITRQYHGIPFTFNVFLKIYASYSCVISSILYAPAFVTFYKY
jgi:hypothetical protein